MKDFSPRRSLRCRLQSPLRLGLGLGLGLVLVACGEAQEPERQALSPGGNIAPLAGELTMTIPFAAGMPTGDLQCGVSYPGVGSSKSEVEFSEFSLYLHDVQLRNQDGQWVPLRMRDDGVWQREGVALLDFLGHGSAACVGGGTPEKNQSIVGFLPEGNYQAIRFTVGVPASHNHIQADMAVAPFNRQRMWWSWTSGFRYLKADVTARSRRGDGSLIEKPHYFSHLGASNCSQDPTTKAYRCLDPRLATIELAIDPARQGVMISPMALFAGDNMAIGRGCMGQHSLDDPDNDPKGEKSTACKGQYASLGLDTELPVASSSIAQTLFRTVDWAGRKVSVASMLPLAQVDTIQGRQNPAFWPRSDYKRPAILDGLSLSSIAASSFSHPPGDLRYASSCLRCHQAQGPGAGRFAFAGTVVRENGMPYNEGQVEIVLAQGKGDRRAKDPKMKLPNPTVHMRVPLDANGQFYATSGAVQRFAQQKGVGPLDYQNTSYQAFLLNRDGERVMAMAPKKSASCNQCHTGSFALKIPDRLLAGPWTPSN